MPRLTRILALGASAAALAVAGHAGAIGVTPSTSTTATYGYTVGSCDIACDQAINGAVVSNASNTLPVTGNTFTLSAPTFPGSSTATSTSQDNPLQISATATANPDGTTGDVDSAYAYTYLIFHITPVGGTPGSIVPVQVTAAMSATGENDPTVGVFGIIGVATGSENLNIFDNFSELPPDYYIWNNQNVNATINLIDGVNYTVRETVYATAAVYGQGSSISATATADPTFTAPLGYGVAVSAGLSSLTPTPANFPTTFYTPHRGPPLGVPEPGTWVLALTGFGLAGGALRRHRAATA